MGQPKKIAGLTPTDGFSVVGSGNEVARQIEAYEKRRTTIVIVCLTVGLGLALIVAAFQTNEAARWEERYNNAVNPVAVSGPAELNDDPALDAALRKVVATTSTCTATIDAVSNNVARENETATQSDQLSNLNDAFKEIVDVCSGARDAQNELRTVINDHTSK